MAVYPLVRGAYASGTGSVTVTIPVGVGAGDIMVLLVETANEAVANDAALLSNGWAHISPSPQGTGTAAGTTSTRLTAYWKRHSGSESNPAVGDAGDHTGGLIIVFRGCSTAGSPIDVSAGDTGSSSTSVTIPSVTTTVPGCLVVSCVAWATDNAGARASGWASSGITALTEIQDSGTTQGNGGGIGVAVGTMREAGATGTTTCTLAAASVQARLQFALIPASVASGSEVPTRLAESTGTVYYVDNTTGNDSRNETQAQNEATPWATIQKAINTITVQSHSGGVKVMVKATGQPYKEHLQDARPSGRQGTAAHMLTIEGYGGRPQVIAPDTPTQNYLCHVYRSGSFYGGYIRFRNLEFGPFARDNAGGITCFYLDGSATHVEFDDVVIHDITPVTSTGRASAIYSVSGTNNVRLWDTVIYNVDVTDVGQDNLSHCLYVGASDFSAVNCVFHSARNGFGCQLYGSTSAARLLFSHCTFANNSMSGLLVHHRYADVTIRNCVMANNDQYGLVGYVEGSPAAARETADWVVLHGNGIAPLSVGANSLLMVSHVTEGDPDFVNAGAGNYRIGEDSSAIDFADIAWSPTTDLDGEPRG